MENNESIRTVVNTLLALLKKEKEALLSSDHSVLAPITEGKVAQLSALANHLETPGAARRFAKDIQKIQLLARENEQLLEAAKNGVFSAHKRLRALIERENTVGAYTEAGLKLQVPGAGVTQRKTA